MSKAKRENITYSVNDGTVRVSLHSRHYMGGDWNANTYVQGEEDVTEAGAIKRLAKALYQAARELEALELE